MKKPHLVLVHSFPTNSILLHGLKEFLDDYFIVHFIDLPGFHKSVLPFKGRVTLKKFSNYLDKKIQELDVDEYIVGGISFGFLVLNNASLDKRCKAILAMEPFINSKCLNISFFNRKKYIIVSNLLRFINIFNFEKRIWKLGHFSKFLQKEFKFPENSISTIFEQIDYRTFFRVIDILMNYNKKPKFHKLPHLLVGNFTDNIIDFSSVVEIFIKNVDDLHIIPEPIDHFPKDLTREYFEKKIPKEDMVKIINYIYY